MRTTTWQILKLAWALVLFPHRKDLRIAQMLWMPDRKDPFYLENDELIRRLHGHYER